MPKMCLKPLPQAKHRYPSELLRKHFMDPRLYNNYGLTNLHFLTPFENRKSGIKPKDGVKV